MLLGLITLRPNTNIPGIKYDFPPNYVDFTLGDVRHSLADFSKVCYIIGYLPKYTVCDVLEYALSWYKNNVK